MINRLYQITHQTVYFMGKISVVMVRQLGTVGVNRSLSLAAYSTGGESR